MAEYGQIENYETHQGHDPGLTPVEEAEDLGISLKPASKRHILDSPPVRRRYRRVRKWWEQARMEQASMRYEAIHDHEFYDGHQWSQRDLIALEERNQGALVFNRVKPTIDWVLGTEKRTRVDYRVLPREPNDAKGAEVKTEVLKYLDDINNGQYVRSDAFRDAIICGIGWKEYGIRADPTDEPIFVRYEDWRNMWWDVHAVERDLSDARYIFRSKWVDFDIAISMFPERASVIRVSMMSERGMPEEDELQFDYDLIRESDTHGEYMPDFYHTLESAALRDRVRLVEAWYRQPVKSKILRGNKLGTLNGARFNEYDKGHRYLVESGYASVHDAIKMVVRIMVFCGNHVLLDAETPYNHNRFPFVPVFAYRRKKTGEPYGVVRQLKDPQEDLNKRRSLAQFIMATKQTKHEDGAIPDEMAFHQELHKPDGMLKVGVGKMDKVEIIENRDLAAQHLEIMREDAEYIESIGGVTDENLGQETNAASGRAIIARQDQGHVVTAELFDNQRLSIQLGGEIETSLVEQFYTGPKLIRILGDKGRADFLAINDEQPDGTIVNDITASKADFKIDTQQWSASVRQAMFESLLNLVSQFPPEVSLQLLDLVVDLSDLPGKEEIVSRIRQINGAQDPNEDPNDPAVIQRKIQELEAMLEQKQIENRAVQLEFEEKEAKIDKDRATADATRSKARVEKAKALQGFQMDAESLKQPPYGNVAGAVQKASGSKPAVKPKPKQK